MITTRQHGNVAQLTLDHTLEPDDCLELRRLAAAAADAEARALVLTGTGQVFCADAAVDMLHNDQFRTVFHQLLHGLTALPIPLLAAVNGPATGIGAQLALTCDLRILAPDASFALPAARHGLPVNPWTVRRLALLAGGATARAVLLGDDEIDATTARHRGLADRIGELDDALDWANDIARLAPLPLHYFKQTLNGLYDPPRWSDDPGPDADDCYYSADAREARRAHAAGGRPQFHKH